jgi:hypothetical protein
MNSTPCPSSVPIHMTSAIAGPISRRLRIAEAAWRLRCYVVADSRDGRTVLPRLGRSRQWNVGEDHRTA